MKKHELEQRTVRDPQPPGRTAACEGSATRDGQATDEQQREIEQFLQRKLAISKELRDVQHQLNAEIDALGLRLKFINIVLVPALVALIGLLYGWRRTPPQPASGMSVGNVPHAFGR